MQCNVFLLIRPRCPAMLCYAINQSEEYPPQHCDVEESVGQEAQVRESTVLRDQDASADAVAHHQRLQVQR